MRVRQGRGLLTLQPARAGSMIIATPWGSEIRQERCRSRMQGPSCPYVHHREQPGGSARYSSSSDFIEKLSLMLMNVNLARVIW